MGIDSEIAQMLTHTITVILGIITGKNIPQTSISTIHDTTEKQHICPADKTPHHNSEILKTLITDFETKPQFRKYTYTITLWILIIISIIVLAFLCLLLLNFPHILDTLPQIFTIIINI